MCGGPFRLRYNKSHKIFSKQNLRQGNRTTLTSPDFGATPRHSGRQLFGEDGLLRGQRWARPNGNNHHQRRRNGGPRRDQRGSPLISEDLKMAASKGNLDEVQNLLNRGLFGPLLACCCSRVREDKQLECLELLLEQGVNMDVHESSHMTPLMFAAQRGHVKVAAKLILAKSDVDKQDNRGWTALCYATMKGEAKLVKLLLDNGADPTKTCSEGTAADIAYGQGLTEISDLLDQIVDPGRVTATTEIGETEAKVRPTPAGDATNRYHVYNDLDLFLCGLDLSELISLFHSHKVDFAELLRLTEEDLEKMGVEQFGSRRKIMRSVHEIHKLKWERGSIRNPSSNVLSQNESLAILENISQHLSYINSCLDYIHKNWSAHQTLADDGQQDGTTVCHLSDITKKLLLKAPKLQISLQRLDNDMKKASRTTRAAGADTIVDPGNRSGLISSSGLFMFFVSGVAIATVAFFWYPVESPQLSPR
ncbi:putative ankyrin repeat, SAM and basic leucine zipper domain-containing protein 1-like isoform X4 [Apostichopus japonicus]|uniref:Ankyrin repeat, SAM and basic leucine zipper domain-containing protein 1 n=1 Tax=Stichopus japonicus TaxID=307972 RepID=A0A2G8KUA3_STIJA|nr:putative ankyrin repeat, SAM and basic leucine zipper domain-containing protein 1-like isoform X4 [Apostichopus japonicus]